MQQLHHLSSLAQLEQQAELNTVRPQLQVLQDTSLSTLLQNLSSVAREVASETHLAQSLAALRGNVSDHKRRLEALQTSVTRLDVVAGRVDEVTRVLGPDGSARIRNISATLNAVIDQAILGASSPAVEADILRKFLTKQIQNHDLRSQTSLLSQLRSRVRRVEGRLNDLSGVEGRLDALEASGVSSNSTRSSRRRNFSSRPRQPCRQRDSNPGLSARKQIRSPVDQAGYTGDGFRCTDINECEVFNGGCSLSPRVECVNEVGSRRCGSCPPGYSGDGVTCSLSPRPCLSNPCHHLASCSDSLGHMLPGFYQCMCPPGYAGNGIGPFGCSPVSGGNGVNACASNPCVHGTCTPNGNTFLCHCLPGYADPCSSSPCQNGGTCSRGVAGGPSFTCACTNAYTGVTCSESIQRCGGLLTGTGGLVHYPSPGIERYDHNISCAWVIVAPVTKIINVTFTEFHLEPDRRCRYDWLQIHDGPRSTAPLIGRFCGTSVPGINNTLFSTHNRLYLWFRSDHSRAGTGFTFNWTAQNPECGGTIRGLQHGSLSSPGYPGNYPNNRNCSWTISTDPGKRLLFHFATLAIETHPNCSFDRLEIRDGLLPTSPLLQQYCTSGSPAPLRTSGSEASILFVTDQSETDAGFHISFSSEPSYPGCGGLITSDEGSFRAPSTDGNYHHNLLCEWVIRVPPSETIQLNITDFHLEGRGSRCYFDYLIIRDGGASDSPLIGKYCGRQAPPPFRSSGNQLFVQFKSDSSVARAGFTARHQVVCGGEFLDPTGTIRSPYFPNPYPHNRECVYVIRQPPGKAVVLNFTSFDVEDSRWARRCVFDYVEIRDGSSGSFPLLGHYCGPPSATPPLTTSTLNFLWLKFRTDASVANRGFEASYWTIDIRCGGILKGTSGSVSSPNNPGTYPGNSDCTWVIEAPPGHVVQITWQMFALESHANCAYDYVEIFDNSSIAMSDAMNRQSAPLQYCGSSLPPVMTSQGEIVTVHFHSDSSLNHDGFSFIYHALNASLVCGGHYHTEVGTLVSPRYPSQYPPSRTCVWTITAPPNRQIALNFATFDVGRSSDCSDDYVEIRNGVHATSPLLTRVCGRNITVPEILSHSQHLFIKMVSNGYYSGGGFQARWDGAATGCGGTMTAVTGEIISPGYPEPYHHRADCYWDIRVSRGSRVVLHITDLEMETMPTCSYDYLEISDPLVPASTRRLCSSQDIVSFNATSNRLKLRFRSDHSANARGFRARYFSSCRNDLTGPHGVIESPNFPDPYPHDRNCSWTIRAPLGNSIRLAFSHFEVENPINPTSRVCHWDYVEVLVGSRDGPAPTLVGHYCGSRLPRAVASDPGMDVMQVIFISDASVALNGFRAEWQIVGCGGVYTKSSDNFTSPNYPRAYPANRNCEWHIRTEPGTRIKITIHGFDIEAPTHTNDCIFDALTVRGGSDDTAPVLTQLCHKNTDEVTVTTSGNTALLTLNSDGSVRGNGFRASYISLPGGCGGEFTAPQGLIQSPNYPSNYDKHADCVWTITVDALHVVKLSFTDFSVEPHENCSYDYLSVYDGRNTSAPLLLQHCGSSLPSPPVWQSSGSFLTLRLKADGSSQSRGFQANYSTGCGARLSLSPGAVGQLKSPNYPSVFQAGVNCTWHLQASPGERIQLVFNHLDINVPPFAWNNGSCISDFVAVHDGAERSSPEIGRFCGSSSPPTVYSSSRHLTVRMVARMATGVGFKATYSEVSTSCGGDLTSERGQFASPFYPDSYPNGYDCIWTITAGAGNRVQLNFPQFELVENENCNTDYVEVHEGDASGPLLLHNCSNTPPSVLTAWDALWVRFRSGDSGTAAGFLASYSLLFNNELSGDSGRIVSPLFPHTYHGIEQFSWRVRVSGNFVSITIEEMTIELDPATDECLSSITLYDGLARSTYTALGTFCGYVPPDNPIVASGPHVIIVFNSRARFEGSRFRLRYNSLDSSNGTTVTNNERDHVDSNCQFNLRVDSVVRFTSPNYPSNYNNSLSCEWVLQAAPHSRIRLFFLFELEEDSRCQYDRIDIYNGVNGVDNWNHTHRLCRREQRYIRIPPSDGRLMKVRFVSDASVTARGFVAIARSVCGGILQEADGFISSPGFPRGNYPNRQDCLWTIKVRPGRTIRLEFDVMRIANTTPNCMDDYLLIRNGDSPSSPYLGQGRYCGRVSPPPLVTASNIATLQFKTDSSNNGRGFHLRYYEVSAACGGSHRLSSDVTNVIISTPSYPHPPHPHTECTWVITAPHDQVINMTFLEQFDIASYDGSCRQAWVEVRDGGTLLAPTLGKYCGSQNPSSVLSTGSVLFVRYYNNITDPHSGFKADTSIGTCGGSIIVDRSGVITSPGYPSAYEENINCSWTLTAPAGHYITFHFLQLNIHSASPNCSAPRGVLEFRELNATGEVLDRVCGSRLPYPLETGSNVAVVNFLAATNPLSATGFSLMYNVSLEECGGEFSGREGSFVSPGYPHGYSHRRRCEWRIQAPAGKRVHIVFTDVELNRYRGRYCRDYLLVFNGVEKHAPLLHAPRALCTARAGVSFNSSMAGLKVIFRTRGHSTARGFSATWTTDEDQECGGELTGTSGSLSSPGLSSGYYNHSLNCVWTFRNPRDTSLVLNIGHLHLEQRCLDFILVEGIAQGEQQFGQKICNGNDDTMLVLPYSTVRVSFVTDYSVNFTGWNMTYSQAACGGYFTGPNDILTSPGYPSAYPNDAHCAWLLQYQDGSQIDFEFTDFNLEDSIHHDYVRVLNGPHSTSPELGRYSGDTNPGNVGPTMTNALMIYFMTDSSTTARGFRAVASQHDAGCGGVLHGLNGNFSSPGFPNDYPSDVECVWTITTSPGHSIRLSFLQQFDIETSANCENDFVEVMEGQMSTSEFSDDPPVLRWIASSKWCGKQLPPSVSTMGEKIRLRFRTNSAVQGKGFKARWESVCGGVFNASSGVLVSPNHPGRYPALANCTYSIIAPSDAFVIINFQAFDLEGGFSGSRCHYDWVQVTHTTSNGYQTQSQKLCGINIPPSISARGRTVLRFITDRSLQRSGFLANYTVKSCGGNINEPTVITLPSSTSYFHNMNCRWNITAPSNKKIVFKFLSLHLEGGYSCTFDRVQIYNGFMTEPENLIGSFCGNHTADLPIRASSGNRATVAFSSDSSVTMEGFRLAVSFTYACGGTVNISSSQQSETIRSLDADNDGNYEPMLHCIWLILAPTDQIVYLQFSRFDLEPQPQNETRNCPFDYLEVLDGVTHKSERLFRGCGSQLPSALSSSSNTMLVIFNSDSANQTAGFTATVSSRAHRCGVTSLRATSVPQALQSPQYPQNYPVSLRCRWVITSIDDSYPIIRFDDVRLESSEHCTKDKLVVQPMSSSDIMDVTFNEPVNNWSSFLNIGGNSFRFIHMTDPVEFCGTSNPHEVQIMSRRVVISFVSDSDTTDHGFRLHYSVGHYNRTYTQQSGLISQYGQNNSYPSTAVILAPPEHYVALYFKRFAVREECSPTNNLTVYDGDSTSATLLETLCGRNTPSPVFSSGRALTLMLSASNNLTGYLAYYVTSRQRYGCGGALSGVNAVLQSPNAPLPSPEGLNCNYTVSVPSPYRVIVQFGMIDFSGAEGCNSTYLELYDVLPDDTASFVARYCGDEVPAVHVAQSSRVALRYVTGRNLQGQGWSMYFGSVQTNPASSECCGVLHVVCCMWCVACGVLHV
ncbi:EGF-like domain, partial [Trinorchestia longiramus]